MSGRRLILLILLALLIRLLVLNLSIGTNDIKTWHSIALASMQSGSCTAYTLGKEVNHPPLAILLASATQFASHQLGIPFHTLFRFLTTAFDFIHIALLLLLLRSRRDVDLVLPALLLLSPITWLISAYHGNTDSILVTLLFAALVAIILNSPLLCGLALGLALNIKVVALFYLMAVLVYCYKSKCQNFLLVFCGAIPGFLLLVALAFPCLRLFQHNVLQYTSVPDRWGIPLLLEMVGGESLIEHYSRISRLLIPLSIFLLSWHAATSKQSPTMVFFNCSAALLILAPGFGVQYILWMLPFAILIFKWDSLFFIASGSLLMFCGYFQFAKNLFPFHSIHDGQFYGPTLAASVMTYIAIVRLLLRSVMV